MVHGDTRGQKWVSGPAPQKGGGGVPTVLRPQSPAHPSSENKHSESRKALPEGSSFTNGLCRHLRGGRTSYVVQQRAPNRRGVTP